MIQDHELVQKILARDRRALAGFYHTFTPRLRRFILQKIADPQDAEEVLQDTLFAFLESIRDFSPSDGRSLTTFEELFILPAKDIFLKRSRVSGRPSMRSQATRSSTFTGEKR